MKTQSRLLPVLIIAGMLLLAALLGYTQAQGEPAVPVRILLDNNGGKIVFSHQTHTQDYQVDCVTCHHERRLIGADEEETPPFAEGEEAINCGTCHAAEFNEEFAAVHMDSFPDDSYCVRCHHTEEEDGVLACNECHDETPIQELIPVRMSAFHDQCMTCHEDIGAGPYGEENCSKCHITK